MNKTNKLLALIISLVLLSISVSAATSIHNSESIEYFTVHQSPSNSFPYQRVWVQGNTQPCCNTQVVYNPTNYYSYASYEYYRPVSYGYRYYAHGYSYQPVKNYAAHYRNNGPTYYRRSSY